MDPLNSDILLFDDWLDFDSFDVHLSRVYKERPENTENGSTHWRVF